MRWGWIVATAVATAAFWAGGVTAVQSERGWSRFDGRDWTLFAPREKQAFMAGFLVGGALADAERMGAADSSAIRRAVDSLYRSGDLRFPFGHVVYVTRLDDFYWWENHAPIPLYLALRDVNARLQRKEP